jgi:hypothetical protein
MRYYAALVSLLLVGLPAPALAECQASLVPGRSSVNVDGMTIGAGLHTDESTGISIRNAGDSPCILRLRIVRGLAGGDPFAPLFQIVGPAGEIEILPFSETSGTSRSDVPADVGANSSRTIRLNFRVDSGWGLRAGRYVEQLRLLLIDENGTELGSDFISLRMNVPQAAALRIFGAAGGGEGPARMDLGQLSSTRETRSAPFQVRVWSTAPYNVTFGSDNGGYLVHANGLDRIRYQLTVDSRQVDLTSPSETHFPSHTGAAGDIHPLELLVGPVTALAGSYSDRVTITITAL